MRSPLGLLAGRAKMYARGLRRLFRASLAPVFVVALLSHAAGAADRTDASDPPHSNPAHQDPFSTASKVMNSSGTLPVFLQFVSDNKPTVDQFIADFLASVPLASDYSLRLVSSDADQLGERHYRLAQLYRNIPVLGGDYIVHENNGSVRAANGDLVSGLDLDPRPVLTEKQALDRAIKHVGADVYKWEDPFWITDLKERTGDPAATYEPTGELCWSPSVFGAIGTPPSYALAYKFDIEAASPHSFQRVIVDAKTGAIVATLPMEANCSSASVTTVFDGSQSISTDKFTGTNWRLRDDCQIPKIRILDYNSATLTASPIEIQNSTNSWTTQNERFGGTVLWETKQAYLYYLNTFVRASYDNANGSVMGLVNAAFNRCPPFPSNCIYTDNASMSFTGGNMLVGLGRDGTLANSFCPLDVISHEYTHAVTGSSAALTYSNESGALNESFSDILGEAVENAVTGTNDWLEGASRSSGAFRSLAAPKLFGHPDTYLGTNWATDTSDNGGVHTNSGVQNHWYYLVAVGGSGINDNGWRYSFSGIGITKAAAIAYRNLTAYLTSGSTYSAARTGSIAAAGDLYGAGSVEQNTVIKAWRAVGIDPCVITCPSSVAPIANAAGQCGATVNYSTPSDNGLCFTVTIGPASGTFFPVGTTSVTATSTSGASCGFDVTVNDTEKPVVICPLPLTVECTSHTGTPAGDPAIQTFLNAFSATDNCPPVPSKSNDAPTTFGHGTSTVNFTALDGHGNSNSCSSTVKVQDTRPPIVTCPADLALECDSHCDASLGGVPATDAAVATWLGLFSAFDVCDPSPTISLPYPVCFKLGNTPVTFTATDHDGNSATCTRIVHVVDTTPPVITVVLDRYALWPPNHKFVTITAAANVTDICDPNPTFVLTSITSNEPENGLGDGDTAPDIADASYGSPDLQFQLRSERSGRGRGRTYTILYTASDLSGNHATKTAQVTVPHDQAGPAMAAEGFNPGGGAFAPGATKFALVVPSQQPFTDDEIFVGGGGSGLGAPQLLRAEDIDLTRAYVGNGAGALTPTRTRLVDVNGDGLTDLVLHYEVAEVQALRAASASEDGPIGLHYQLNASHTYLVNDIFALGARVSLPAEATASEPPGTAGVGGTGTAGGGDSAPAKQAGALAGAVALPGITHFVGVYPNPFERNATMAFDLSTEQDVSLSVYDLRGARVRTLKTGRVAAGRYQVTWDGRDPFGRRLSGGIYLVQFQAGSVHVTRKAVLMK